VLLAKTLGHFFETVQHSKRFEPQDRRLLVRRSPPSSWQEMTDASPSGTNGSMQLRKRKAKHKEAKDDSSSEDFSDLSDEWNDYSDSEASASSQTVKEKPTPQPEKWWTLGITTKWPRGWQIEHALRELLQNAIDSIARRKNIDCDRVLISDIGSHNCESCCCSILPHA